MAWSGHRKGQMIGAMKRPDGQKAIELAQKKVDVSTHTPDAWGVKYRSTDLSQAQKGKELGDEIARAAQVGGQSEPDEEVFVREEPEEDEEEDNEEDEQNDDNEEGDDEGYSESPSLPKERLCETVTSSFAIVMLLPRLHSAETAKTPGAWRTWMTINRLVLIIVWIVARSEIGAAQQCPIGCQSKIDALQNEVAALNRAFAQQVPYLEKFNLTPTQQEPSHSLSAEQVLPNYLNILLVHVTVDGKQTVVLLPGTRPAPSPPSYVPNQAVFLAGCRNSGNNSDLARVSLFLGLLRQDASGKDVFGVRATVEGCNATSGQIPVQITVLSKL